MAALFGGFSREFSPPTGLPPAAPRLAGYAADLYQLYHQAQSPESFGAAVAYLPQVLRTMEELP